MDRYYACGEVSVPWPAMREAQQSGKLALALDENLAPHIASNLSQFTSARSAIGAAFKFWGCVLFIRLCLSVYLAVVSAWWWALAGVVSSALVWAMHRKGTAQNLLQSAMDAPEFYECVRMQRGWPYKLDDETARKFAPPRS